ncbi:MAG: 5-formyltetrahydrofolate cyclo-ligase [Spirochaetaceae bacterium]|nr:5-formyltetrahydrofolate cyclo-ligase [Spirochaetaceae bacterium]
MRTATPATDDRGSLRGRARRTRDAIPAAERARLSAQVCARARSLLEAAGADTVLVYVSFRSEVETAGLIAELRRTHRVAAPRVAASGRMEAMLLSDQPLVRSRLGIMEPPPTAAPVEPASIDAVLVPGLAFDTDGFRLGYGGGYYDRFLARCPRALRIGLAFEPQIVESVRPHAHDQPLHHIVTERRVIDAVRR